MLEAVCERGIDPCLALERNDAYSFFAAIGARVIAGPALTNISDFRTILVKTAAATFHHTSHKAPANFKWMMEIRLWFSSCLGVSRLNDDITCIRLISVLLAE